MTNCDQLTVATSLKRGADDFLEGDEIVVTATYKPKDTTQLERFKDAGVELSKDWEADLRCWLEEHFDYRVEIRRGNEVIARQLPLAKVHITKLNYLSLVWRWDTSGHPPGAYTAQVKLEEKPASPPDPEPCDEFLAVKKAETMQEKG